MKKTLEELTKGYSLVWEETFDYEGRPKEEDFTFETGNHQWANRELQAYTDREANVWVKDGALFLCARKEKDGERDYTSARVTTYGKHSFRYGVFAFRAKLPKGLGSWPAIWMLPDSIKAGRRWPECGEIDIMEHAAREQDKVIFSLHSLRHNHTRTDTRQYSTSAQIPGVSEAFHEYVLVWDEDAVSYYVDGNCCCRYEKAEDEAAGTDAWPFDQPFYLIFNIAVGGFMGGEVREEDLPFVMEIDAIKVYQKSEKSV